MEIILFLCLWWIIYNILYSPKARIRILQREIYRLPIKTARLKRSRPDLADHLIKNCKNRISMKHKMTNVLLDYYFDTEEDKEYIEKIRKYLSTFSEHTCEIGKI